MTDPRSPSDDDLVLAAFDGNTNSDARAPLSPSVQAEIDGLRAVRALLNDDAAWGEQSGADVPPPHLLDAIVRAEVAARSDVVRQAIATGSSPAPAPSAWQRLSSWLVGGGVLVGAAAAVLLTVQREPAIQAEATAAAPQMAPTAIAADGAPAPEAPAPPPPPPPAAPAAAAIAAPADGPAEAAPDAEPAKDTLGFANAKATAGARAESRVAEIAGGGLVVADEAMKAKEATVDGLARRGDVGSAVGGFAGADKKPVAPGKVAAKKADASMDSMEAEADDAFVAPVSKSAPMAAAPPAAAPPPAKPAEPAPAASANDVRRLFRERMAEKKAEAIEEAKGAAKAAPSAEGMIRDRQLQEANNTLLTAERELAQRRFGTALDLALRAEATSGGALGLAPVSTQARALRGLGRSADAARLGNRLLSANPSDPQLMAGVVAAAAAAYDVGDRQLCRRLSQLALQKPNADEKLRAEAKRLLGLVAQPAATQPAEAEAAAPAKP